MTRLRLRPARFAAAPSGPSIVRSKRKPGVTVAYWLSEDASVRFTVQRRRRGLVRIAGAYTHHGRAGANAFMFTGRVRKRRLPVGRYTLVASATGRAGKAAARARARFTIVR